MTRIRLPEKCKSCEMISDHRCRVFGARPISSIKFCHDSTVADYKVRHNL